MKKIFILLFTSVLVSCNTSTEKKLVENSGYAQGSTYQIKYLVKGEKDFGQDINTIFQDIDMSMSTYIETSHISEVNKGGVWVEVDKHFLDVLNRSIEIAEETNSAFDPTVGPLVRIWGFNFEEIRQDVTEEMITEAKNTTGYQQMEIDGSRVRLPEGFSLDFNAIAQGYTVDVIAEMLEDEGITDYMVEVGGEVRTKGKNPGGNTWTIGVDKPQEEIDNTERFQFIIALDNSGLATSGNYRKFWVDEESGIKYSHTIDPVTGRPAKNRLLSASIISPSTMDADAYATACMVMGLEECKAFLEKKSDLEGYLVFTDDNGDWATYVTAGFQQMVK
jgi:thiamine biosynthesis lipoprotein